MKKIPVDSLLCGAFSRCFRTRQQADPECGVPVSLYVERNRRLRTSPSYGNAVELFGEVGSHWQKDDFWKGYYWDGGILYKHRLARYKNGMLRFRFGPQFGATEKKFFFGLEAGVEYCYVFRNGWEFALIQKNNVNFLHGDTFRNGLLLGVKIPF